MLACRPLAWCLIRLGSQSSTCSSTAVACVLCAKASTWASYTNSSSGRLLVGGLLCDDDAHQSGPWFDEAYTVRRRLRAIDGPALCVRIRAPVGDLDLRLRTCVVVVDHELGAQPESAVAVVISC